LGHPPGYVIGPSGDVKEVLERGSIPLGILPDMDLSPSDPVELQAGDLVLFITDGILEALSPGHALFGVERMLEVVRANRDRRAIEIIQSLHQDVFDFTGLTRPQDDLTTVVIKVDANAPE
jgi:sigma-B regulation protein RsbU (phosphoserine phosphatase)